MSHTENAVELSDNIKTRLDQVFAAATEEDQHAVTELVTYAQSGNKAPRLVTVTPGMGAVIFRIYNGQNRDFRESKATLFASVMEKKGWHDQTQGIRFLNTGKLGDGQHRVLAQVLAGQTREWDVGFGMTVESIQALDIGTPRRASDFLGIIGISNPAAKESALRSAFSYLHNLVSDQEGMGTAYKLLTKPDVVASVQMHDATLTTAVTIGERSVTNVQKPIMAVKEATAFAFLMLLKGWPEERLIEKLAAFQLGHGDSVGGANSPRFLAGGLLARDDKAREKISATGRLAIAVKAFVLEESGAAAIRVNELRGAIKNLPDPQFPAAELAKAA